MQDGSSAVFNVIARDQGHYKGPSGALLHTVTFLVYLFIYYFFFCYFTSKYPMTCANSVDFHQAPRIAAPDPGLNCLQMCFLLETMST